ncbi:unnamed protein product [Colias eurytheme]|nr:unnamed protein product [Colias eurytheme]
MGGVSDRDNRCGVPGGASGKTATSAQRAGGAVTDRHTATPPRRSAPAGPFRRERTLALLHGRAVTHMTHPAGHHPHIQRERSDTFHTFVKLQCL